MQHYMIPCFNESEVGLEKLEEGQLFFVVNNGKLVLTSLLNKNVVNKTAKEVLEDSTKSLQLNIEYTKNKSFIQNIQVNENENLLLINPIKFNSLVMTENSRVVIL